MKLSKIALACLIATGTMAPQFASADDAFEFHGYARAGATYEGDGATSVGPSEHNAGVALGRLGNESNGHEVVLLKKFEGDNDTNWEVGFMIEDWGTIASKQIWAGGTNIFASQPNAYLWAGKVFHGRLQSGLNDYFLTINDGAGTGIKGLELGGAKVDLGVVTNDQTNYLVTSKFADISLGDAVSLDILANYGFADNTVEGVNAYQLLGVLKGWGHKFYYRYADNVGNSLSWGKEEGISSHFFTFEGSTGFTDTFGLEYLAAYGMFDKVDDVNDHNLLTLIARPTFQWNNIHSTWLEFGYGQVDFDNGNQNTGWKATFSQNIAVGGVTWARPQIRFFATVGNESNEQSGGVTVNESNDPIIIGAMFEAWW